MGLTLRKKCRERCDLSKQRIKCAHLKVKDSYYVQFPVTDDGRCLRLAQPGNGRLTRWRVGSTNKGEAQKHEAIIKAKLLAGTLESKRMKQLVVTFEQWAKEYIEIEEVKRLRSYRERCQRIRDVLVPFFGKKLLQDITAKDVEDFRQERGKGRAVATVNVDHNIVKHMLKQAMKRDLLSRNVASLIPAPKPKNARNRVLEPEEWDRLYNAASDWFQPVLLTGYHTGMRLEEIIGLTWDRVDLEKNRIFLPGSLTNIGQSREVPITPIRKRTLHQLRGKDGVTRISGLVFQKDGRKLTHTYRIVGSLCEEQNIPNFVFHDLRHCAVTNLADAGVDTETIMKIVGHSSVEMFLRYRTIKAEKLDAAMTSLNTLITLRQTAARQASEITAL